MARRKSLAALGVGITALGIAAAGMAYAGGIGSGAAQPTEAGLSSLQPQANELLRTEVKVVEHLIEDVRGTMRAERIGAPDGFTAISAGWDIPSGNGSESVIVRRSRPGSDGQGWEVVLQNTTNVDPNIDVTVYVVCIR